MTSKFISRIVIYNLLIKKKKKQFNSKFQDLKIGTKLIFEKFYYQIFSIKINFL